MSFWDNPASWPVTSWPSQPGGTVTGTVTRMAVRQSRYARLQLCVELDGDGKERWCNNGLWREMGAARVEPGDRVTVTRLEDGWAVEKTTAPAAAAAPAQAGPSW